MQRNADVGVLSNFYADGWYRWKAVTSLPGHFGSVPNTRRNFLNSGLRPSNRQEIFNAGCLSRFSPKFPKCRSETPFPRYPSHESLHYPPDIRDIPNACTRREQCRRYLQKKAKHSKKTTAAEVTDRFGPGPRPGGACKEHA